MAFEHEQFRRFLQGGSDNNNNCAPKLASAHPAAQQCGRQSSSSQAPHLHHCTMAPSSLAVAGRHHRRPGKVSWNSSNSNNKCEPLDARGRRAALLVCLKLALLSGWLVHELAVGFDESQCLQLTNWSTTAGGGHQQQQQNKAAGTAEAQTNTSPLLMAAAAGDINKVLPGERTPVGTTFTTGHSLSPQRSIPTPTVDQHPQGSETHHQPGAVPKRRRKVILRRRLLRKGASTTPNASAAPLAKQEGAAVRRVVWRIVPLKKLPAADQRNGELGEKPVRTKTGIVMMRKARGKDGRERRIERRRIGMERPSQQATDEHTSSGNQLDLSMIRESGGLRTGQQQQAKQEPKQPMLAIDAALNMPEQLDILADSMVCYTRTVFDCWCLIQCFCLALFLFGLHLRHRLLAIIPVGVDVVSIAVGTIFGISTLIFALILLLLVPELPLNALLPYFGASALIQMATAVFAWSTFVQLGAVNSTTVGKNKEEGR